ncbi:MAG: BspA family leucine-rich repeat surface protein, partial [Promethearchaeota archaeon]
YSNYSAAIHTYIPAGIYAVNITGHLTGWQFNDWGDDKLKLVEISQWGTVNLGNAGRYFRGCSNLHLTATDALDLTGTTYLAQAFQGCTNLGSIGNMNGWDVSSVTLMNSMFCDASAFNQAIGDWDLSSVTDMTYMFFGAAAFNKSIGDWYVSRVTTMYMMFREASAFDQDIGGWDVSKITDMYMMFSYASAFNQDIGGWDVSNVNFMNKMFEGVTLSTTNYNALLQGWAQLALQSGVSFHAGNSQYSLGGDAATARQYIIDTFGWAITDGGADVVAPTWVQIPQDQTIGSAEAFIYDINATDNDAISHYWLNDTSLFQIDDYTGLITNSTALPDGTTYYLEVFVNDTSGNAISAAFSIEICDGTAPVWTIMPSDQVLNEEESLNYHVSATDNVAIHSYWLNDTSIFVIDPTGLIINTTFLTIGKYYLEVFVNDTSGNVISAAFSIRVWEIISPVWTTIPADQILIEGESLNYHVSATDNVGIDCYWLDDTVTFQIDGTGIFLLWLNDTNMFQIDADGVITNRTTLVVGVYYLTIYVNDTSGNEISVDISIEVQDAPTEDEPTDDEPTDDEPTDDEGNNPGIPGYSLVVILGGCISLITSLTRKISRKGKN